MLSQKMQDAYNKQINEEMYSAYLYLSMSAYFETINLKGFAHWMKIQFNEEMFHAMKFYTHIIERGGHVKLAAINQPEHKWNSPKEIYEASLNHEFHITKCIDDLMNLAIDERDHAGRNMLNWFVDEQVEEESNFTEILEKLKMIGDYTPMLLSLDKELSTRVSTVDILNPNAPAQP